MKRWRIVQDIYEGDDAEPTLTHVFYGESPDQAQRVFDAHMRTDAFMRGCVSRARFSDFSCHAESRLERLVEGGQWRRDGR